MDLFDAFFSAASAFNLIVVFFVGSAFALIGLALLAKHFLSDRKSKRVKVKLVGVRVAERTNGHRKSSIYYPVFEYVGPNGNLIRAECDSGSSFLSNKIPGKKLTVFISEDRPYQASIPGKGLLIFGLIFAAIGGGLIYHSLTAFSFTPISIPGGGLLLLWMAYKLSKIIKPKDEWETFKQFRERTGKEFIEKREALPFLGKAEIFDLLKKQDTAFKRNMPLMVLIAFGLIGGGVWVGKSTFRMTTLGAQAPGVVVGLKKSRNSDSTTYYPLVKFKDQHGIYTQFQDQVGSSPPAYHAGEDVMVYYMAADPRIAMIDRGIWNWTFTAILGALGLLILWITFAQYGAVRYRQSHI